MAKAYGVAVLCKKAKDTAEGLAKSGGKGKSGRPRWRQSEIDVGKTLGQRVREQVSYLNGKEVRRGLEGSVRPDFVMEGRACFEVKNYLLENRSSMVSKIVKQAKKRAIHLPEGMKQKIIIDFRGSKASPAIKDQITKTIVEKSEGIIAAKDVRFVP
jgi:hypothetical protein